MNIVFLAVKNNALFFGIVFVIFENIAIFAVSFSLTNTPIEKKKRHCVILFAENQSVPKRKHLHLLFFMRPPFVSFFAANSSRSICLYSSKDPSKTATLPGSSEYSLGMTTHNSSATMETRRSS